MKSLKVHMIIAIIIGNILLSSSPAPGEAHTRQEYRVKAAFIYNFAKFVEWPQDAFSHSDAPLVFTVFGDDPFGEVLRTLENKTVRDRPFRVSKIDQLDDLNPCHILYIPQSEQARLPEIQQKIKEWPVLTVSDLSRFTQDGGCIQFFLAGKKVRFAINSQAAEKRGLQISSQLLRLAQVPRGDK